MPFICDFCLNHSGQQQEPLNLITVQGRQDEENAMTGGATIVKQEVEDSNFQILRSDYLNALLDGDAAILRQLDPNCELNSKDLTYISSSEENERDYSPLHNGQTNRQKTLPLFPLTRLKKRRVMYYAPLTVEGFEFDALVDTGACLTAMPISTFTRILESPPSNMLLCRDKPSLDIQAANGQS